MIIYFNYMLKARKKTNNLRYIAQLYAWLYILIIGLRLKNVYLFAWYFFRVKKKLKMDIVGIKVLFLLEI